MAEAPDDEITLVIDRSVAVVLFEFLSRTVDDADGEAMAEFIEDEAEIPALWALLAGLESVLTEPMAEDYERRVLKARDAVMKRFGGAFSGKGDD
ncbi:hypothetical protein [Ancylobacter rudongensis]|uniref:Uncharacterized protein n=1 Tax=Ancylobacter rudongensis TaxID=177413 RepID=A0A1G4PSP6_9HYPH|nr:hypothetical protein [Ancylobacter rudongensis]RTL92105.1 hypothetical protein EJV44_18465 [Ancylobacter aquaticus]SCW35306.1 hypothetical protein SAMN05660859_0751 [Ancylobacter rudongensis]